MATFNCTSTGAWDGPPDGYTYQWQRSPDTVHWTDIPGAAGSSYTTTLADADQYIACVVTATNLIGSATALSNPIFIPDLSTPTRRFSPSTAAIDERTAPVMASFDSPSPDS